MIVYIVWKLVVVQDGYFWYECEVEGLRVVAVTVRGRVVVRVYGDGAAEPQHVVQRRDRSRGGHRRRLLQLLFKSGNSK